MANRDAKGRFLPGHKFAQLGGLTTAQKAAPADCEHCRQYGYETWMQHLGHLGLSAVMATAPEVGLWIRKQIRARNRENGRPPHNGLYKW